MDTKEKVDRNYNWLFTLLSLAVIAFLGWVYMTWHPEEGNNLGKLIINYIPSALVALSAIPVIYFLFELMGLRFFKKTINLDSDEVAKRIIESLEQQKYPHLKSFHETYRNVNWEELLEDCGDNSQIDIVVYYFDSWVNSNYESLLNFFRKKNSKIRIFVSNPEDTSILTNVQRLFPEYTIEQIKQKISNTNNRFKSALKEAQGDTSRVEFYYVPHFLNYSAQCFNDKYLVLSFFEMFRTQSKIDSPALIIDIEGSSHLSNYWQKELKGLLSVSKKIQ